VIPAASSRGLSDGGSGVGESVVCNDSRLLEDHLRKTGSKLAKQVRERGAEEILNDMQLLVGPPELRYIQNVAIMMFCEHPEKFFGYTYVQMTSFPKGSVENPSISEDFPNITGSVLQMIQATMERFRNLIIREKVIKVPNQMEALRIFNYPCKSENQYTDKWEIEKKNILFFWNKKCECILKPMRFSRLVKCGRIHIENTNERLSR